MVDGEGIHPTDEMVQDVKNAPTPSDLTGLRSYLGLLNYYVKFLPDLSAVIAPITNFLRKDVAWNWTPECDRAFRESKALLLDNQILCFYDQKLPVRLPCDASAYGLGAVISHMFPGGRGTANCVCLSNA